MSNLRGSANYIWSTNETNVLGRGATGNVYKGVSKKTGESVAVKVFNHPNDYRHALAVQKQESNEFDLMKVLSHENIVKMIACEEEDISRKKVIIMELCNGGSLLNILEDPQNSYGLEEEEFLQVLKDLSAGMKYLRDKKISHRDLKPANIMKYISECGRSVYKLTDFGTAKVVPDDQQFMSLHGTVEYLHPDMYEKYIFCDRDKSFGATVDLWSIGVTLYHVATSSLPFTPFETPRKNRDTMYKILSNKPSGIISGIQHSEYGPIEWSAELPETCLLSQGLKDLVTVLLAGILEYNNEKIWTFDQFFSYVTDIVSNKVFHVFYINEEKEITLYMQPNKKLKDLKYQIHAQTEVSPSSQLLLFDKSLFTNQINASAEVSTFPTTTLDQPLLLVHMEKTDIKDLKKMIKIDSLNALFPKFLETSSGSDVLVAKNWCSIAHAIKRQIIKSVRCRELLLRVPKILISLTLDNIANLRSSSALLKERFDAIKHRVDLLERSGSLVSHFLAAFPGDHNCNSELQKINFIISEEKKAKDQVNKKMKDLRSSISLIEDKIFFAKTEWDKALQECSTLDGCVERADTYVGQMRESWQVFKSKDPRYRDFHMLEKIKMAQTRAKLLSLLQDECLKAYLQVSSKLDDWYSGMQATMVQCRCLDGELASASEYLRSYSNVLHKSESEVYKTSEKIATLLRLAEITKIQNSNNNYCSSKDKTSMENAKYMSDLKSRHSLLSHINHLKMQFEELSLVADENNSYIETLTSMFEDVREQNNS